MSTRRLYRKTDLAQRLRATNPEGRQHCWIFGCKQPPGNTSGNGLGRLCRAHLEHHRRHGDPLKGSYKAAQVAPHRAAAKAWLKEYASNAYVAAALGGVEALMLSSGRAIEPRNLRGVPAAARAASVWARLRDKGRAREDVLATILGVAWPTTQTSNGQNQSIGLFRSARLCPAWAAVRSSDGLYTVPQTGA